ncbi:MAG TPA: hypothetical protein VHJ17_17800 [Thermomonospora sp.]|nr:hypothetical protein [Thermomonospora sp.]
MASPPERTSLVVCTPGRHHDGRHMRKAWRPQHSDLRRLFFDRLEDEHLRSLADIWVRLAPDEEGRADQHSS